MTRDDDAARYLIRPSDAAAPWAGVPSAARAAVGLEDVRAAFQWRQQQPIAAVPEPLRPAAVLVLVYARADVAQLALVKRSLHVGSHRGDVAFPGGVLEDGETPQQAALREAWEELAIAPGLVEVVGKLTSVAALHTGFCIHPVVGVSRAPLVFTPSAHEIDAVIEVPLADLLEPTRYREEVWQAPGGGASSIPFFDLPDGDTVWGATAFVLVELLTILTG